MAAKALEKKEAILADRRPLIAANWKMHKTPDEAFRDASSIVEMTQQAVKTVDILIAPSFVCLERTAKALSGSGVALGSQNMHWEAYGAYTGEVSASMILACGCTFVILGHSERRQYFGETDKGVNLKTLAAVEAGLVPVVCVGESLKEREKGETFNVLDRQVQEGLKNVPFKPDRLPVLAYEPIWAIGTGLTATPEQAQQAHEHIRAGLEQICGKTLANSVRILYGGSVKPANIGQLMQMPDIDGALVGGASLEPADFASLANFGQ